MQEFYDPDRNPFIQWLKYQWDINFHSIAESADIQGSPERSISRAVIKDVQGRFFLIEKFNKKKYRLRNMVAKAVCYLNQNGLDQALPYKESRDGSFLPFYKDACFQVSPFLDSTGIKQPDYLNSGAMGESFALFLIRLSTSSSGIEEQMPMPSFSIKKYIYTLFDRMKMHDTAVYHAFLPMLEFLEQSFMDIHDQLPVRFCHGDLHPLNVIWDNDRIKAVIDWEFTGMKPDIYDAANLVGCAGIENPHGLGMPMVMRFLDRLKRNIFFSKMGWRFFPEYILALRFAWLAEWLRKKDKEMIDMENAYMRILMENTDVLRKGWNFVK